MGKFTKTLLIGQESDWGTPVAVAKDIGIITDVSDSMSREVTQTQGLTSLSTQHITSGVVDPNLSVTFQFQHGRILEYAIGSVAHANTSSDYKHTFTASNEPPSMTVESSEGQGTDVTLTYAGMMVNDLTISSQLNGILSCTANLVGKTVASTASTTAAVEDDLINFPHSLVSVDIDGTTADTVQSVTINITKNVQRIGGLGSNIYQDGKATELKFTFSAQLGYTDNTYEQLWLGGAAPSGTSDPTVFDFLLDANNGVALGSGNRRLYLELENCIMDNFSKAASIGNMIFIDINGHGTLKECYSVDDIADGTW